MPVRRGKESASISDQHLRQWQASENPGGNLVIESPKIVETAAQQIAFIPLSVPRNEIQVVMGPGIREVIAAVTAQGIAIVGPWFTWHVRRPSDSFDFKICLPVATPVSPVGRVQAGELPAATVARTVYSGGYEGLGAAWGELGAWIADSALTPREDLWECYTLGPETSDDPAAWRTELNRPLVATQAR